MKDQLSFKLCMLANVAKAKCIITANERVVTEDQVEPLKSIVDEVMEDHTIKDLIKHVFVARRTTLTLDTCKHDVDLEKVSACDDLLLNIISSVHDMCMSM